VRIDTIEAALVSSGIVAAAGGWDAAPDAGYRVAYGLARDLLLTGHDVIADSVNPVRVTREAWARVAADAGSRCVDVEVVCSDRELHRRRVEGRSSDLAGLTVPTWEQVEARQYEPWGEPVLRVDTTAGVDAAVRTILGAVQPTP
jgi:predicted kinase